MSYRIWLPVLFLGLMAVCSAKDFEPFEGAQPVAVLLLETPSAPVMGAETPRIAIYENGSVIFTRTGTDAKQQTYFYADIGFFTMSSIIRHLNTVAFYPGLKSSYSVSHASEDGAALIYLHTGGKTVVTSIYGLGPGDMSGNGNLPAGKIPEPVRDLYQYLLTVQFIPDRLWHSPYVEAMLWPFNDVYGGVIHWPKNWPDLKSDRAIERKSGYSIFLNSSERDDLKAFLAKEKNNTAVEINGRNWTVASRPVFPSEPVWRKAFSAIPES